MRYRWSRKPPSSFISRIFFTPLLTVSVIATQQEGVAARRMVSEVRWPGAASSSPAMNLPTVGAPLACLRPVDVLNFVFADRALMMKS
jgi:hypothetical protein